MKRIWISMVAAGIGAVIGCVGPNGALVGTGGAGHGGNSTGTSTIGGDSGLPCDVADFLVAHCTSCHGNPTSDGAPMSLLSYADLTAPSKTDATQTYAQLSLTRIKDATSPMPPGIHLAQSDYGAFETWVTSGAQMGSCGTIDAGPGDTTFTDPMATTCDGTVHAATCVESKTMNPGMPCLGCHNNPQSFAPPCNAFSDQGPSFALAGTVFARGHVADGCRTTGVDLTQAKVVITDKNGKEHNVSVNSAGNFYWDTFVLGSLAKPYSARVEYQGKVRAMSATQTDGDCNGCHTADGTNSAPGRIALPQ